MVDQREERDPRIQNVLRTYHRPGWELYMYILTEFSWQHYDLGVVLPIVQMENRGTE